jgi:tripartite-type tricarboxylate transporter receptor subunit TctC
VRTWNYTRTVCAAIGVTVFALTPAPAQNYPTRNITLVVPYAAGGGLDVFARIIGPRLAERLGKAIIIENKPGAGTVIGARYAAKADADGYTLMLGTSTPLAIAVSLHKDLGYDPARDFIPVALVANAPFVLIVDPKLPVKNVGDLVKLAASTKDQLSYGSAGPGSPQHLSMELLKSMTSMKLVHVPYKGDIQAVTDLLAGHIPMQFAEATPALPLIADGKVRAIGFSSSVRNPQAPEIPTLSENGAPGFDLVSWQMIVAPAGTPPTIVERLNQEIKAVIDLPEVKADYAKTGRISVDYLSTEQLKVFLKDEIERLGKVVQQAGIANSE